MPTARLFSDPKLFDCGSWNPFLSSLRVPAPLAPSACLGSDVAWCNVPPGIRRVQVPSLALPLTSCVILV